MQQLIKNAIQYDIRYTGLFFTLQGERLGYGGAGRTGVAS